MAQPERRVVRMEGESRIAGALALDGMGTSS